MNIMKDKKYQIYVRYEFWKRTGKEFNYWRLLNNDIYSENEAKEKIKEIKNEFGYIDQKTKLKHEYKIEEVK